MVNHLQPNSSIPPHRFIESLFYHNPVIGTSLSYPKITMYICIPSIDSIANRPIETEYLPTFRVMRLKHLTC